ncbi:MAG: ribose-5-phosphate isomerase RpiA, partial [Candidatus Poseidoniaceae archaeon]|nr:ribose-5-phosphate isomerase RpiA [Candidatus Poseidoniaceae archaeon]
MFSQEHGIAMDAAAELKKAAGIAACDVVKNGMKVGLGTGSTVAYTVIEIGRRIAEEGLQIIGVPTSIATQNLAVEVGIPLAELGELGGLDVVIDGADEFDPAFQLIKGGGGALLREKIVAQSAAAMVVVADDRKQVETLGDFPLPVEVTPFSWRETARQLALVLEQNGCAGSIVLRR